MVICVSAVRFAKGEHSTMKSVNWLLFDCQICKTLSFLHFILHNQRNFKNLRERQSPELI